MSRVPEEYHWYDFWRHRRHRRRLSTIKIAHSTPRRHHMLGAITITVGQKTTLTVLGFDQFGAPFTGPIPTPTWTVSDATQDSSTPQVDGSDVLASLAAGTASVTASVTTAAGLVLTDTETITNLAVVPVLSSIKIDHTVPA
jgi:hypothetical protein